MLNRYFCKVPRKICGISGIRLASTEADHVGFIGLGQMGAYMALNLLKNNNCVTACEVSKERINFIKSEAGEHQKNLFFASSPTNLAQTLPKNSVIVTSLPSHPHVEKVYLDKDDGLLSGSSQAGTLFIDCTTGDPDMAKKVAVAAQQSGCRFVDSPMSGGVPAAKSGQLTFMVGGSVDNFNSAKIVLDKMGKNVFHCGDIGSGLAVKIVNNMLLAITMIGTSEAMNMGIRMGLDASTLAKILSVSTGRSWSLDTYNPVPGVMPGVPSSREYEGGFGTSLMAKDLGLAQTVSTAVKAPTPLGSAAHQIYRQLENSGLGHLDFSVIYKQLSKWDK